MRFFLWLERLTYFPFVTKHSHCLVCKAYTQALWRILLLLKENRELRAYLAEIESKQSS